MKLGNKQNARLIYEASRKGDTPAGWKRLGQGAYRIAYLCPDGVVYKVLYDDYSDQNRTEFENFQQIRAGRRRLPRGWRIAPLKMYSFIEDGYQINVIAMRYIEGSQVEFPPNVSSYTEQDEFLAKIGAQRAFDSCKIWDMHEGNFVVTPNGKKVIIDLGE